MAPTIGSSPNKTYASVHTDESSALKSEKMQPAALVDSVDSTEKKESGLQRWTRILTILQGMLSSLLSLAIAVWQGKVYFTYQRTKAEPGAWPDTPNLVPTILLFSISIAVFVFDACMLLAYLMPGKRRAKWGIAVGNAAYYVVTSVKTVSYAISSAISKTSFDFGNATNQNSDLWSWTCTDQAATMDAMTQAESNCNTQVRYHTPSANVMFAAR